MEVLSPAFKKKRGDRNALFAPGVFQVPTAQNNPRAIFRGGTFCLPSRYIQFYSLGQIPRNGTRVSKKKLLVKPLTHKRQYLKSKTVLFNGRLFYLRRSNKIDVMLFAAFIDLEDERHLHSLLLRKGSLPLGRLAIRF